MVSRKHPYSPYYILSLNKLRNEQKRHLINYYRTIHPLSMFVLYMDFFMFIVFTLNFIAAPLLIPHLSLTQRQQVFAFKNGMHVFLIVTTFFSGYYDKTNNVVHLRRSKCILHYLKTYFIFDCLALSPSLMRTLKYFNIINDSSIIVRLLPPFLLLFSYARYLYCLEVLNQMRLYFGLTHYTYKAIKIIIDLVTCMFLASLFTYYSLKEVRAFAKSTPLENAEFTIRMMMMVSHGFEVKAHHSADFLCPVVLIFSGFVLQLVLYVYIMELWYKFYSTANQEATVYNYLSAYMRYKALPQNMRDRIWLYLEFKYQGQYYKDSIIKKVLSQSLKREILVTISKESIQSVDLFRHLPESVMTKLRANLITEIYLPGDTIIKAETIGKDMFFILAGTVLISNKQNEEIGVLRDGAHFGEVALVIKIARVANVIALMPCEVYKLSRKHFLETVEQYPSFLQYTKSLAMERIIHFYGEKSSNAIPQESELDILQKAASSKSTFLGED